MKSAALACTALATASLLAYPFLSKPATTTTSKNNPIIQFDTSTIANSNVSWQGKRASCFVCDEFHIFGFVYFAAKEDDRYRCICESCLQLGYNPASLRVETGLSIRAHCIRDGIYAKLPEQEQVARERARQQAKAQEYRQMHQGKILRSNDVVTQEATLAAYLAEFYASPNVKGLFLFHCDTFCSTQIGQRRCQDGNDMRNNYRFRY